MRIQTALRVATLFVAVVTLSAQAQEIWLAPQAAPANTPLHRADDLMDMFTAEAPWREAAAHVHVFQLPASYIGHAPQREIDVIVADLNRRHLLLAVEVGVMNIGPKSTNPRCGGFGQVEGYGTPEWAKSVSGKIKDAGGTIAYLAMDEPLFYGHYFTGKPGGQPGCHSSIIEILGLIEPTLSAFIAEYPGVVVGDIEPTDIAEHGGWKDDVASWTDGFRRLTGKPLAFMHLDIPFVHSNEAAYAGDFYRYVESLRNQQSIGAIGVIYNGTPADQSDESWTRDARDHIHLLEDKIGLHPDHALIQSWNEYPRHALPDSSPAALTSLVMFYALRNR